MNLTKVELETVCGVTSVLPVHTEPEVAFCGRSNVGKSSLINALIGRSSYARVSKEPGKTQTINYYKLNDELYLVDLPGYGYAKVSQQEREAWGEMIETYLNESESLKVVFLLVDIRHEPTADDKQMYEWIDYVGYQPVVLCTKADKLNRSQIDRRVKEIAKALKASEDAIIIPTSSENGLGVDTVLDFFDQILEW